MINRQNIYKIYIKSCFVLERERERERERESDIERVRARDYDIERGTYLDYVGCW